jgi:hypothetical protein
LRFIYLSLAREGKGPAQSRAADQRGSGEREQGGGWEH